MLYYSVKEVSKMIGVSYSTLSSWSAKGLIKFYKKDETRGHSISEEDLNLFLEEHPRQRSFYNDWASKNGKPIEKEPEKPQVGMMSSAALKLEIARKQEELANTISTIKAEIKIYQAFYKARCLLEQVEPEDSVTDDIHISINQD